MLVCHFFIILNFRLVTFIWTDPEAVPRRNTLPFGGNPRCNPPKVQNPNPHPPPPRSSLDDHTLLTAVVRFIHFYQTFWSALPTSPGQHLRILRAGRLDSQS